MAKCNRCGKETELYEAGVPICPSCLDEQDRKRSSVKKPPHPLAPDNPSEGA